MFTQFKLTIMASILAVAVIGFLQLRYHTVKAELDSARQQIILLSAQIKDQNVAIKQWQAKADDEKNRVDEAEKKVQEQTAILQHETQDILNQKVSPVCAAAVQWGALEAIKLAKQW